MDAGQESSFDAQWMLTSLLGADHTDARVAGLATAGEGEFPHGVCTGIWAVAWPDPIDCCPSLADAVSLSQTKLRQRKTRWLKHFLRGTKTRFGWPTPIPWLGSCPAPRSSRLRLLHPFEIMRRRHAERSAKHRRECAGAVVADVEGDVGDALTRGKAGECFH